MKRIFSALLLGSFSLTMFTGCGSQKFNTMPLQQNLMQPRQQVSTLSAKGLNNFHNFVIESTFKTLDKNSDRFLNLKEYTIMFNGQMAQGLPAAVLPPMQSETPAISAANAKENSLDAFDRFKEMDINRDYKLSLTEVRNQSNFLPFDKNLFRAIAALGFGFLDKDKTKTITREEFVAQAGSDHSLQLANSTIFYNGDRNFDGKLSFSEYEDILYSMVVARANTPEPSEPAQPPSDPAQPPSEPSEPSQPAPSEPTDGPLPG